MEPKILQCETGYTRFVVAWHHNIGIVHRSVSSNIPLSQRPDDWNCGQDPSLVIIWVQVSTGHATTVQWKCKSVDEKHKKTKILLTVKCLSMLTKNMTFKFLIKSDQLHPSSQKMLGKPHKDWNKIQILQQQLLLHEIQLNSDRWWKQIIKSDTNCLLTPQVFLRAAW